MLNDCTSSSLWQKTALFGWGVLTISQPGVARDVGCSVMSGLVGVGQLGQSYFGEVQRGGAAAGLGIGMTKGNWETLQVFRSVVWCVWCVAREWSSISNARGASRESCGPELVQ